MPNEPPSTKTPGSRRLRYVERAAQLGREAERVAGVAYALDEETARRFVGDVVVLLTSIDRLASALLVASASPEKEDWRDVECLAFSLGFRARRDLYCLEHLRDTRAVDGAIVAAFALDGIRADLVGVTRELERIDVGPTSTL